MRVLLQPTSPLFGAARLVVAIMLVLAAAPTNAQGTKLDEVERALQQDRAKAEELDRQARALKEEIKTLRRDLVAAARQAQDLEERLSALEGSLAELEDRRTRKHAALNARHAELARTLGALQRIALRPPEAAITAPGSPIETLRSAMLLRVAVPAIERRAGVLRDELASLTRLRSEITRERTSLAKATERLFQEQRRLSALMDRKRGLETTTSAERQDAHDRVRKLAKEAKSLRELVGKLERESQDRAEREAREAAKREARRAAEAPRETQQALLSPPTERAPLARPGNVRPFPDSPGVSAMLMPARGRMVNLFGQRGGDGDSEAKGISIRTRNLAQVVAPYDGRVAYAGTFRRYGPILIIEHGERYHTLLAGLDRIDAVVGQWVLAGEPVGTMTQAGNGDPVLYLELRRSGQPINPLPWLATTNDKVQG